MTDGTVPMKTASLMYMLIAIILIWNAIFSLNLITGTYDISTHTYNISVVVLIVFLLLFFFYMLYQGLISESLIALFVTISVGSYSFAYMINGVQPEPLFDPIVIIAGLIPVVVIALNRNRIPLVIGCVLMLIGCLMTINKTDMTSMTVRLALLFLAGAIFGIYSGYVMYLAMRGHHTFEDVRRAKNASSMCETIGYILLAMTFLYCISMNDMVDEEQLLIMQMMLTISSVTAMAVAVYSSVNGSISSGTTILTLAVFAFLIGLVNRYEGFKIAPFVCMIISLPLVFTAYRFFRKRDMLLMSVSIVSIICVALVYWNQHIDVRIVHQLSHFVFWGDVALMIYAAFARILYIETDRKIVPLFDGGSFANVEEPWDTRYQKRTEERDNSLALQTYLMMAIGLMILGGHLVNMYFDMFEVNTKLFHFALMTVSILMILFSIENLRKGRLTETVGALSVGVMLLSYSACGFWDIEYLTYQDLVPSICILVCGIMFVLHRDYALSVSFICTAASNMAIIGLDSIEGILIGGVLMFVAGTIIMVRYNVEKIKNGRNPTITEHGGVPDNVRLSTLARTLGSLLLGMVLILLAVDGKADTKNIIIMGLLSAMACCASIYGMMKDDAPGFILLFFISLMIFVLCVCYMLSENVTLNFMKNIFMWVFIPVIIVFIKRGKYISAGISILLFVTLAMSTFTTWDLATSAMYLISGLALCALAMYNWLVNEDVIKPVIDPKLFGFSLNKE